MTNTIIYIYGPGVLINISDLQLDLENRYCLCNISEEEDSKITYKGDEVSELIISKNLDYIKIDADFGIFQSLIFYFSQLVKEVEPKHLFSFGLSGDPSDYKRLPVFKNEEECEKYLFIDQDCDSCS